MSDTAIDMAKVTQMLDAGWNITLFKGVMGSYEVRAMHNNPAMMRRVKDRLLKEAKATPGHIVLPGMTLAQTVEEWNFDDGFLMTDDFTPEQALTRCAYKVFGEII